MISVIDQGGLTYEKRIDALNKIGHFYSDQDSIKAFEYIVEALRLSRKHKYAEGEISAIFSTGNYYLRVGNLDSSEAQIRLAYRKSDSVNYIKGMARAKDAQAKVYFLRGDFSGSIALSEESIRLYNQIGDRRMLAMAHDQISNTYIQLGKYKNSFENKLSALQIYQEIDDRRGLTNLYLNFGVIHYYLNDLDKALLYYKKSLAISETEKYLSETGTNLSNIGLVYEELDQLDSAEHFYLKSIQIAEELEFRRLLGWTFDGMAKVELKRKNLDLAMMWIEKSLEARKSGAANFEIGRTYLTQGDYYLHRQEFSRAISLYQKGLAASKRVNDAISYRDGLRKTSQAYRSMGDFAKTLEYLDLFMAMNDSLVLEEQLRKIAIHEVESKMDSMVMVQKKDWQLYESVIERKRASERSLLVLVGLFFVLGCIAYFAYKVKIKSNRQLETLNLEIKKQRDNLDRLNSDKSQFLAILSHDIKGAIQELYWFTAVFRQHMRKKNDHELDVLLDELDYSAKNVNLLLENLLYWGAQDEGKVAYSPAKVNLRQSVEEVLKVFRVRVRSKQITLEFPDENNDAFVTADRNTLLAIVRNLISNAFKFTNVGGNIKIAILKRSNDVVLSVKDSGVGIEETLLNELVDSSERMTTEGTAGEKGTGIGLSIVKNFVRLNNGNLSVKSEVGKGTEFTVSLPKG